MVGALFFVGAVCGALFNVKAFAALLLVLVPIVGVFLWGGLWPGEGGVGASLALSVASFVAIQVGYVATLLWRAARERGRAARGAKRKAPGVPPRP